MSVEITFRIIDDSDGYNDVSVSSETCADIMIEQSSQAVAVTRDMASDLIRALQMLLSEGSRK